MFYIHISFCHVSDFMDGYQNDIGFAVLIIKVLILSEDLENYSNHWLIYIINLIGKLSESFVFFLC